jgi:2-dehydropantoate 2-reductase
MKRFVIVGAGAVGCYLGGRLAAAGERVRLVGRAHIVDALRSGGLRVTDLDGFGGTLTGADLDAMVDLDAAIARDPGITVLLCVKSGATVRTAARLEAVCAPQTTVLSMQNGVDNLQRLQHEAPSLTPVACMVPYNIVLGESPLHVHRASSGRLRIGDAPQTRALAAAFARAGLAPLFERDMRAVLWGKLLLNLNNPINALSDLPLVEQLRNRDLRCCLARLQSEALAAMRAAGIFPARVGAVPARWMPPLLRLPDALFERLAGRLLKADRSARSSMWDDLQRGRRTEVDDLCGAVVRLGRAHGVATPANAAMIDLIGAWRPGPVDPRELRRRLAASAPGTTPY